MKRIVFHTIFWVFILLYVFDYLIDYYSLKTSILYSAFEIIIYISEFYLNLFVLIPYFFHKRFKIAYSISVFVTLSVFCSVYFAFGLDKELLALTTFRAITTYFLNHILFFIISYFVWHYNKYIKERDVRFKAEEQILILEKKNDLSETKLDTQNILIKSKHQIIKISISDILYIESMHKYVKIFTSENKYTTLFSLTAIEKELPNNVFYRCHRSFIINLDKVKLIEGNKVIIQDYEVPISKNNKTELISKLGKKI